MTATDTTLDAPQVQQAILLQVAVDQGNRIVRVRCAAISGTDTASRKDFLERVFSAAHVDWVDLRFNEATALIHCAEGGLPFADQISKLALAVRGEDRELNLSLPQDCFEQANIRVYRFGNRLTTWNITGLRADRFRLRHPRLSRDHMLGRTIERLVLSMPGVRDARLGIWTGDLVIHVDLLQFDVDALLAVVQHATDERSFSPVGSSSLKMAGKTASLGVAALADFVVPALMPISAVLLVATNLQTLSNVSSDLKRRHIGLSTLLATIVIGTLATGQFLASAIMAWSFDFWRQRHCRDIAAERGLLLEDASPLPACSMVSALDGTIRAQPIFALNFSDQVRVGIGDIVPVDGHLIDGSGVVDEHCVRGVSGVRRVQVGDQLLAGTFVLGGEVVMTVDRVGDETRLAAIGRVIQAATVPQQGRHAPTAHGEQFADEFVVPTMATAGLGLLTGGVGTAVAILRPDYAHAESLSLSLEDIATMASCLAMGCILRTPLALAALEDSDTLILIDYPALHRQRLVLSTISGPHDDKREMLRWAASMARHLADERGDALAAAARLQGCILVEVSPDSFGTSAGLAIVCRQSKRMLVLREGPATKEPALRPLVLEIDGMIAATLEFSRSLAFVATEAIDRLHDSGSIRTLVFVDDPAVDVESLAVQLHAQVGGHLTHPEAVTSTIRQLRADGRRVAIAGRCRLFPEAVAAANVAIDMESDANIDTSSAEIFSLSGDLAVIADLRLLAQQRQNRILTSRRLSILPNLACVVGAFTLGFTSLISAIVCNAFTLGIYTRSTANLHANRKSRGLRSRTRGLFRNSSAVQGFSSLNLKGIDNASRLHAVTTSNLEPKTADWKAVSP